MNPVSHVVLTGPPRWGHLRGLCALAAKIATECPVVVTLLLPNVPNIFSMGNVEATRGFCAIEKPKGELRVVALGEPFVPGSARIASAEKESFEPIWTALMKEFAIKCSVTGKAYASVLKPGLAIIDGLQFALFPVIRSVNPAPPILLWQFGAAAGIAASGMLTASAPGTMQNALLEDFTPHEQVNGRPIPIDGRVIDVPGLPRAYDWENYPYVIPYLGTGSRLVYLVHLYVKAMYACDGLITACAPAYDGEEVLAYFDAWAARRNVPIYHLGPMRFFEPGTTNFGQVSATKEIEASDPDSAAAILGFLDHTLSVKGDCSVVYISFGSVFWPVGNPDHLWAAVEALAKRDIPFVLVHPSPLAQIPEEVASRYGPHGSRRDKGLVVPWAPQQVVLAHKAVGWFLTHGGAGGVMDGLTQGVPLIGWPLMGDQPANISYLTYVADVAFELIEGRTGELGLRPMLTSGKTPTGALENFKAEFEGVLDSMVGEVGARKRENARRMRAELAKAWTKGGSAREAFDAFAARFNL